MYLYKRKLDNVSMLHLLRAVWARICIYANFRMCCLVFGQKMWLIVSYDHAFNVGSLISTVSDLSQASTFTGCLFPPDISCYMIGIYQQHHSLI